MKLVIVHRYENPDRFGLHSNAPRGTLKEGVFWSVGLFDPARLQERLNTYGPLETSSLPLGQLIDCAPVEWHAAMKRGDMLNRFTVLTTD